MTAACRRGARGVQSGSQLRMRGLTQGPSRVQPRWARGGCLAAASSVSACPKGDLVRCRLAALFAVHAAAAAVLHAARHLRGTRPPQSPGRRTVAPWAGRDERSVTVLPGRRVSGSLRNGPWRASSAWSGPWSCKGRGHWQGRAMSEIIARLSSLRPRQAIR